MEKHSVYFTICTISWQRKSYSANERVIDDLHSPDTFDTHLGERWVLIVTPCILHLIVLVLHYFCIISISYNMLIRSAFYKKMVLNSTLWCLYMLLMRILFWKLAVSQMASSVHAAEKIICVINFVPPRFSLWSWHRWVFILPLCSRYLYWSSKQF